VRDADDQRRAGSVIVVDVRPADERAIAAINAPFETFDGDNRARLEALPKDTALAFLCHHGGRSAQAAEQFRALGFSKVYNITGGIDAWSNDVDNSVPKY
jgi:monothiol glutaredoxin